MDSKVLSGSQTESFISAINNVEFTNKTCLPYNGSDVDIISKLFAETRLNWNIRSFESYKSACPDNITPVEPCFFLVEEYL